MLVVGWLWNLMAPRPLQSLLLCAIGVECFKGVVEILAGRGVDLAGALTYGWDNEKLRHDVRIVTRVVWTIYLGATIVFFIMPSVMVAIIAWIVMISLSLFPVECLGGTLLSKFTLSLLGTLAPWAWKTPTPLSEVVIGDILTSYAKVFAEWDMFLFCYLLRTGSEESSNCLPSLLSVLLVCYPSFCRLRQCIGDFRSAGQKSIRPLLNSFKYSTSFPVVYVSFLLLHPNVHSSWRSLWLLLVSINTTFSTAWDIIVDWDFGHYPLSRFLLTSETIGRGSFSNHPIKQASYYRVFLRPILLIAPHNPIVYYVAILFNMAARASWMVRVLFATFYPPGHPFVAYLDSSNAIFFFQLVEVLRRFVWLIFRIEAFQAQQSQTPITLQPLMSSN